MTETFEIVRTPIKLREPIMFDLCSCWGSRRVHVDGELHYIIGDDFSLDRLSVFLDETQYCVNIKFDEDIDKCWSKIQLCLDRHVPVTVKTSKVVSENRLQQMSEVLHCSIQTDMNLPSKFSGNSLGNRIWREEVAEPLREMLIQCKSWKLDTSVTYRYDLIDSSLFDVYELIEYFRLGVSHSFLEFINKTGNSDFSNYFDYNVLTGEWEPKEKYILKIAEEINEYSKLRKIPLELVQYNYDGSQRNVYRYMSSGYAKMPMGMPQFVYEKNIIGIYKETDCPPQGYVCPHCGKYFILPVDEFNGI